MKILLDENTIQDKISEIAESLNLRHAGDPTSVVMVGILNGCFMFYSDLVKKLDFKIECDFIRVKSYLGKNKQGDIQITKDLETPIKGKHIYLIDDILDSGNTMKAVIDYLTVKKPSQIGIVTLLSRKNKTIDNHHLYSGFELANEWVIGMGMNDDKGFNRNLPNIYSI
jgi:hypoxanthine phosphoribosyltransferase